MDSSTLQKVNKRWCELKKIKMWEYSDTSANEDNSFRNHIR